MQVSGHLGDTLLAVTAAGQVRSLASGQIGRALWSPRGDLVAVTVATATSVRLSSSGRSGREVGLAGHVVADFGYVPGGCSSDGLARSRGLPGAVRSTSRTAPPSSRTDVGGGAMTSLYTVPGQETDCDMGNYALHVPADPRCVRKSGHVLARVESSDDPNASRDDRPVRAGTPRIAEGKDETVIRFIVVLCKPGSPSIVEVPDQIAKQYALEVIHDSAIRQPGCFTLSSTPLPRRGTLSRSDDILNMVGIPPEVYGRVSLWPPGSARVPGRFGR